jgi:hypothetical protein
MNKYISTNERKSLKRSIHRLPDFVEKSLIDNFLVDIYITRPAYQKNDYIGWITRSKREETKKKRLTQMIRELQENDKYMGMKYQYTPK